MASTYPQPPHATKSQKALWVSVGMGIMGLMGLIVMLLFSNFPITP